MYSPEIVDRRLHAAAKAGIKFKRLAREDCIAITTELEQLCFNDRGDRLPEGQLTRDLDAREHQFIQSERVLCKADFTYYLSRYHTVERDPGVGTESGQGPATPLPSQYHLIAMMGKREEVCYAEKAKYGFTAGILVYAHKCRQVAYTATSRAATCHRMIFYPGTRCFAATLKEGPEGTGELYKRDTLSIDALPFWLRPTTDQYTARVKDKELALESPFSTRLTYQAENQAHGIGTGTQQDVSHLTEVSLWQYAHRIRYSFVPSIPKSVNTLHIQEATSAGKGGYWQEVTEGCRKRKKGFEDYIYVFIPWYLNTLKYRANAPGNWNPEEHTVKHALLIERTSPEFCEGNTYTPTRDQLYWWETTRSLHAQNGELAAFLSNYPATPEQSFTNWAQGALPIELIEEMEMECMHPYPYEVLTAG